MRLDPIRRQPARSSRSTARASSIRYSAVGRHCQRRAKQWERCSRPEAHTKRRHPLSVSRDRKRPSKCRGHARNGRAARATIARFGVLLPRECENRLRAGCGVGNSARENKSQLAPNGAQHTINLRRRGDVLDELLVPALSPPRFVVGEGIAETIGVTVAIARLAFE